MYTYGVPPFVIAAQRALFRYADRMGGLRGTGSDGKCLNDEAGFLIRAGGLEKVVMGHVEGMPVNVCGRSCVVLDLHTGVLQ